MDYNSLVGRAHRDHAISMYFTDLGIKHLEDLAVLTWGDSSLMNVRDSDDPALAHLTLGTQIGTVVGIAHRSILGPFRGLVRLLDLFSR